MGLRLRTIETLGVEHLTQSQLTLERMLQEQLTIELNVRSVVRQVEPISPQVRRGPLAQLAEQLTLNLACFVRGFPNLTKRLLPLVPRRRRLAGRAHYLRIGFYAHPVSTWLSTQLALKNTESEANGW
jgi:hypothetical protein